MYKKQILNLIILPFLLIPIKEREYNSNFNLNYMMMQLNLLGKVYFSKKYEAPPQV